MKTSLNKKLKELDKKELISLVTSLSKLSIKNNNYLNGALGLINLNQVFDDSKIKIKNSFTIGRASLKNARSAINDFKRISKDEKYLIEIYLYYFSCAIKFETDAGDLYERYYLVVEKVFENLINLLKKHSDLKVKYKTEIVDLVSKSDSGWGHKDTLEDILWSLYNLD